MKTGKVFWMVILFILTISGALAQKKMNSEIFKSLPQSLDLKDDVQKYLVVTNHVNSDIFGNFFNKMQVKGEYTRGLADDKVKWNNVTVGMSMQPEGEFTEGENLEYMEDFTYTPSEEMIQPEKFEHFTGMYTAFAKNLVWDVLGIEGLAWAHFEKLEPNKPFHAADFNGELDLAGQGTFENKNMLLTWTGISEMNGELCALIEYRTFSNPLEYSTEETDMKGLSHYWGNIWVSLEDKQIEHATLLEIVSAEMSFPGQANKQIMTITREIEVKKLL
ncbi:MAG: hypothetical protein ACQETJ_00615 [Bacteroidota bacterium]